MDWITLYIIATILILPTLIYGSIAQNKTLSTFDKFAKETTKSNLAGAELARLLLDKAGATDIDVVEINGKLTDCYDPINKVVKLSKATYTSVSVAALGVVAHEVGHAVQDHQNMFLFKLRSALIPICNFVSRAFIPLVLLGSILGFTLWIPSAGYIITWVGIGMYALSLIISFATLGVEKDASNKALALIKQTGMFDESEIRDANTVLKAAITTYIASFTTSLLYFLRFLSYAMIFRRD